MNWWPICVSGALSVSGAFLVFSITLRVLDLHIWEGVIEFDAT